MDRDKDIFGYIQAQEAAYQKKINITEGWDWSMKDHINLTVLYKNSQLKNGKGEFTPVKNITRPILNLQHRAEGFDVKNIVLFVDDSGKYHLSFLVKKYHEKWARENRMDTFIDEMVESYVDFGGALIKNVNDVKPEVVPLQSLVFCDQTDLLSGPIGIKHYYSPDQLMDMASRGWGDTNNGASATLEEVITLSREVKRDDITGQQSQTPGKYIEVYEVHGTLPEKFLDPTTQSKKYVSQLQIVCFYQKSGEKGKITLYRAEEPKSPFKFIKRDPVYGRALGFGGAEELFEPQVWVNYDMIRINDMLDSASKTILKAMGPNSAAIANKNKVRNMDNLSIVDVGPDSDLSQVDTFPRNLKLFEDNVAQWEAHAQQMGSANDAIMGENPTAGTPFKLQELVTNESHSLHEYRKGQIATFLDEIYLDWIMPKIGRSITKGTEFLAELDLEELQYVADCLVRNEANNLIKEHILNGEEIDPQAVEKFKQQVRDDFKRKGNRHFIKVLDGEMKGLNLSVKTNIAGKQKDLAGQVDKLTNVFRTIIANPYILQSPPIAQLFNKIIEASGLDPIDLSNFNVPALPTRRLTETMDYKDLPPQAQQGMLEMAGIQMQQPGQQPSQTPQQTSAPVAAR